MTGYIIRRLLWMIPVLFFVAAITFFLMHLVPGGPWDSDRKLPPGAIENLNRIYNLDKPVPVQFALYMKNLARGDLGQSFRGDRAVTDRIKDGLPITATLGIAIGSVGVYLMRAERAFRIAYQAVDPTTGPDAASGTKS